METGTRAIIELAWARRLGLHDDALHADASGSSDGGARTTRTDVAVATFVRLWEHRVLVGPGWLLELAADVDDDVLASGPGLLALTARGPGGTGPARLLGEATLAYADAYVTHDDLEVVVVADDPQALHDLERQCPPDDVTEVGLAAMAERFVLLDDREETTAASGYAEWEGILAHLGVLVPPSARREGRGTLAGAMAVNDALDSGLVPQWRHRPENAASAGLARRLGFAPVGTQTTVLLGGTSTAA